MREVIEELGTADEKGVCVLWVEAALGLGLGRE